MNRRRFAAGALGAAALPWLQPADAQARTRFSFAVIGDVPYNALEARDVPRLLAEAAADVDFVIHVGDLKASRESCDDDLLGARFALLAASPRPLVFTPVDNEWVDCAGARAGRFDPLERLQHLRGLFFSRPAALGPGPLAVQRQSDADPASPFAENLRWRHEDIVFVTVNLPGSANATQVPRVPAAHNEARNAANAAWLREAFAQASRTAARGIVVVAHADPGFERDARWLGSVAPSLQEDGYAGFRQTLRALVESSTVRVLFVHGDSHRFAVDQPLRDARGAPMERLVRVNVFGSPFAASWVRVSVDGATTSVFSVNARHLEPRRP
jgi:hypothetical protein